MVDWLIQRRKQADLSQRKLAENIGVVHSLVGKVEKGERRLDPVELVLYCNGMNVDPCNVIKLIQRQLNLNAEGKRLWRQPPDR